MVVFNGTADNDNTRGTNGDDHMFGLEGNDVLFGDAGRDTIFGGSGDDTLDGGQGMDALSGGEGRDVLIGGAGEDVLDGGAGVDVVWLSGKRTDYLVSANGSFGYVMDLRLGTNFDGVDVFMNIERLYFAGDNTTTYLVATAPVAVDDAVTLIEDTPYTSTVSLIANDTDVDGPSKTAVAGTFTTEQGGSLVLAADGSYTYTAAANFAGTDTVDYTVTDGTLSDTGTLTITVGLADHDVVGGDVFLQGIFLELGVSASGSLGTANDAPSNYHPAVGNGPPNTYRPEIFGSIAIVVDRDGFTSGAAPTTNDFTLPGSPVDTIGFGFNGLSFIQDEREGERAIATTTTDISLNGILSTQTMGVISNASGSMKVTQTIELDPSATYFKTTILVENVGTTTLNDVRFLRSFDPDQDLKSNDYTTNNDVVSNPTVGNDIAISSALGPFSGVPIKLVAFDQDARASNYGFYNYDVYDARAYTSPVDLNGANVDEAITISFSFGNLTTGSTATKSFYTTFNGNAGGKDMLVGGTGNDVLNAGGGDDIIVGASGSDVLTGAGGNDTFIFSRGSGADQITDFTPGAGINDVIEVRGMGFSDFAGIEAASTQVGADTVIDLGAGDSLVLIGVQRAYLHGDDFMFAL